MLSTFLQENMDISKEECKLAKETEEDENLNDKPLSKPIEFVGKLMRSLSVNHVTQQTDDKVEEESKQNKRMRKRRALSCEHPSSTLYLNEENALSDDSAKDDLCSYFGGHSFFSNHSSSLIIEKESEGDIFTKQVYSQHASEGNLRKSYRCASRAQDRASLVHLVESNVPTRLALDSTWSE